MNYNKITPLLFIFFCAYIQNVTAQTLNINDDTIFVNTKTEIQLVFPTLPTSFSTIPTNTQYRIWDSPTGINLIAQSENYSPVTLSVTEAQRNHRFILIFKKDNTNTLFYDYSTEKKLAQHIKETAFSKPIGPIKPEKKKQKKEITVAEPVDKSANYNALVEQGDRDMMLENYQNARLSFEKAHALQPNEVIPLRRLEAVIIKLAEKEKIAQQDTNKKYLLLTEEAKNKIDQKKYTEASNIYKMALGLKPGDVYVTQQLQIINNLVAEESAQIKKQRINELPNAKIEKEQQRLSDKQLINQNKYDTAVQSANNFFNAGDYENAKREYNKALGFSNKEWPRLQIAKINKILSQQMIQEKQTTAKNKYDSIVKLADNFFNTADYENAKKEYNKALSFSNTDWPKLQITKINKIASQQIVQENADKAKLAQQQSELELNTKTDSLAAIAELKKKYNLALSMGRSSYLKNDLSNAKAFYEEAMNLQPSQQLPKNQLKIINDKLEDSVREAQLNNNYEHIIALADSQVIAKSYDSAITNYKQASLLKPLESYPHKQVRYVQSEFVQIEKRKREQKEQQYKDALTRADKAVTDKKYDDALAAYTEALNIHPENEYAKRRLEIISFQVEKARIEKLSQDSVKEVVPIKKPKRKKY